MKALTSVVALLAGLSSVQASPTPRNNGGSSSHKTWLDSAGLSANNKQLFTYSMDILDNNFGLPLLWGTAKLSSWYAVGLLARQGTGDVALANKVIANLLTQQYTNTSFVGYGTFKSSLTSIYADGDSIYAPSIYNSYDPNNALFVTIAGIIIDSQFGDLIDPTVRSNLRKAMYMATVGDGYRVGGVNDDNLRPCYTNPWVMRLVASAYVGHISNDANMTYWAEEWAQEFVDLFDEYDTISEYNGGTYAGVSLFALSLAQYVPTNTTLFKEAPRIIKSIWDQTAETYNPTLNTLSGPWDRTYGFDLTQYYGILGSAITGVIGMDGTYPMPKPLDGSVHYTDMAMIPMQMVTAPYAEGQLSSASKAKITTFSGDHEFSVQAISPPFDARPRNYTYWVADGLSAGGVEFDENTVGGPSINQPSFSPGVILWDAGKTAAGSGFISHYPTNPSVSIVASSTNLTIRYPPTQDFPNGTVSNQLQLSVSPLPGPQLGADAFASGTQSLPGLDVTLSGNVVENANRSFTFTGAQINDFYYYNLTYTWDAAWGAANVPELVVAFTKTTPPTYDLILQ